MAPTTLVTFLVRTPPSTRSVALYGSWDNFSTSYPMRRDSRTGQEHWSGCHSFSNIICDGDPQPNRRPRNGGLKMGGTYWYYYKLDDDLEFHNSAEPSTTTCPLLPGQLVNVLNVPFALSSANTRNRNDSVSSTSSDIQTMDPSDKFLNPRPVPARPSLPRLKTSPSFPSAPWSTDNSPLSAEFRRGRSVSSRQPNPSGDANTLRIIRLTKKSSFDVPSRSTSRGSNRSVGIIGAFRALASPRTTSPDTALERGRSVTSDKGPSRHHGSLPRGLSNRSITPKRNIRVQTPPMPELAAASSAASTPALPVPTVTGELPLRDDPQDLGQLNLGLAISSFQQHRRQRNGSREPSSLRNSLSNEEAKAYLANDTPLTPYRPLETLNEVNSPAGTPVWPLTAIKVEAENVVDDMRGPAVNKRLPTLPNSPSSAYPPSSAGGDSPLQDFDQKLTNLQSHFSATTIDTESYTGSFMYQGQSRFSDWTCATSRLSPRSDYAASLIDIEPMSPAELEEVDNADPIQVVGEAATALKPPQNHLAATKDGLPSASSFSTVSSEDWSATGSSDDAQAAWKRFQHYSLPTDEIESTTTLKQAVSPNGRTPMVVHNHTHSSEYKSHVESLNQSDLPHSTSMQQLLDELRYLGDMIQHH
ncbi:hypothetical protein PV10_00865 [Exophiala mesophila]|uniref:Uncharacterized protein n=1 Tax=Exophiala mesophila TaxID=212818 RepID=A0A0D1ZT53_EXOME|nr:uncharacterized protein PV10_00865 [Exophiala mesophila]KIV97069.1 hypothetical protein PV10_00865 [Exophiala mesophila]